MISTRSLKLSDDIDQVTQLSDDIDQVTKLSDDIDQITQTNSSSLKI